MNDDIKRTVRKCPECQKRLPSQPKQPIRQMNKATFPMQVIGTDLFMISGRDFIVAVDQYSGFPFVGQFFSPPTTNSVINHLEVWFNLFGVPQEIVSDNGPQYNSIEYDQYAKERNIELVPASPYHPEGNGLAESAVKNVKSLLLKYANNWKAFTRALLLWRNFPNKSGSSPAEMFLGHRHSVTHAAWAIRFSNREFHQGGREA